MRHSTAKGYREKYEKTQGSDSMNQQQICPPAHDDEQQQEATALLLQQQQQYSNTQSSSSSSSGSSTLYVQLTSRLLRRHLNHHRTYFYSEGTKKKTWNMAQKKTKKPSEIRTTDAEVTGTATYLLPHTNYCIHRPRLVCIYVLL